MIASVGAPVVSIGEFAAVSIPVAVPRSGDIGYHVPRRARPAPVAAPLSPVIAAAESASAPMSVGAPTISQDAAIVMRTATITTRHAVGTPTIKLDDSFERDLELLLLAGVV